MKRQSKQDEKSEKVDINMSPLIDCVFLLLIFFIVTTVFVKNTGVDIKKPQAASAKSLKNDSIMISISQDGRIYYAGTVVSLNSIRGIVRQQLNVKEVPVVILADEDSRSGQLIKLIDECKMAGAKSVSIAADMKE
ncbi:MAG: biopolymer transporter ExbD [Kiritimatiellae bacterium]|jgi:biopolymer transport protein ExbD|nr:biopolymer transporter ExbD [Kiritimatiellia bacterium]